MQGLDAEFMRQYRVKYKLLPRQNEDNEGANGDGNHSDSRKLYV